MGILSRFSDIMSANINDMLDKMEDPAKQVDQALREAKESFAKVKAETAGVMATEKAAKREYDAAAETVAKYDAAARNALKAGNEGDARTLLAKKQEAEALAASAKSAYDAAHKNSEAIRQMHDKLASDIQTMEQARNSVKAKVAVAKTRDQINKTQAVVDSAQGATSAFARAQEKAQAMLDKSEAMSELNADPVDAGAELLNKYGSGVPSSVDDELAKMKAELGM